MHVPEMVIPHFVHGGNENARESTMGDERGPAGKWPKLVQEVVGASRCVLEGLCPGRRERVSLLVEWPGELRPAGVARLEPRSLELAKVKLHKVVVHAHRYPQPLSRLLGKVAAARERGAPDALGRKGNEGVHAMLALLFAARSEGDVSPPREEMFGVRRRLGVSHHENPLPHAKVHASRPPSDRQHRRRTTPLSRPPRKR